MKEEMFMLRLGLPVKSITSANKLEGDRKVTVPNLLPSEAI